MQLYGTIILVRGNDCTAVKLRCIAYSTQAAAPTVAFYNLKSYFLSLLLYSAVESLYEYCLLSFSRLLALLILGLVIKSRIVVKFSLHSKLELLLVVCFAL